MLDREAILGSPETDRTSPSITRILLGWCAILSAACTHAAPLVHAPTSEAEASALKTALLGSCRVTATQVPGEEREEAFGLAWAFYADGTAFYSVMGIPVARFNYRIDGRNIVTDGPYKALRVDRWEAPTMTWFIYDISEFYYCTQVGEAGQDHSLGAAR